VRGLLDLAFAKKTDFHLIHQSVGNTTQSGKNLVPCFHKL
jgi:hypothetical protein